MPVRRLGHSAVSLGAGLTTGRERPAQHCGRACTAPGSTMPLGPCHRNTCPIGPVSVGARCAIAGRSGLGQAITRTAVRAAVASRPREESLPVMRPPAGAAGDQSRHRGGATSQ